MRAWQWFVRSCRIGFGVVVVLVASMSFVAAFIPFFDPRPEGGAPRLLAWGVIALLSAGLITLGMRLVFNRPNRGGLLPVWALRLMAVYMGAMPIFVIVTGRAAEWRWSQCLQAVLFVLGAFSLWALAEWRKRSHLEA